MIVERPSLCTSYSRTGTSISGCVFEPGVLHWTRRFESAVSRDADVFEFGVFTLEVVSGSKRWDAAAGPEEKDLLETA